MTSWMTRFGGISLCLKSPRIHPRDGSLRSMRDQAIIAVSTEVIVELADDFSFAAKAAADAANPKVQE